MLRHFLLAAVFIANTIIAKAQNVFKITANTIFKTTGGAIITLQDMNLDVDGTINQLPGEGGFKFFFRPESRYRGHRYQDVLSF